MTPPICPTCRSVREGTELRYCKANNGVAWQCRECNVMVGSWIPHRLLPEVNVLALPPWYETRQGNLF